MADANFENPVILNLMTSYGPLLIGAMLSCVLYGMSVIQMFMYFNTYEQDSIRMKLYVVLVWVFETASVICVLVALWPVLILKWGSLHELSLTQPPMLHRVWMTALGTFLVHMFYIWRIFMVNGGKALLPCLLIPFTLYQMIETWVYVNAGLNNTSLTTLSGRTTTALGTSGRAAVAFVDIGIVVLMIYALLKDGPPQFKSSQKMIFKLIVLTINTGLWTAVFAIIVLALLIRYPNDLFYTAIDFPLTSLYLNSLLANLNARESIRGTLDTDYNTFENSKTGPATFRSAYRAARGTLNTIDIQTSTDTHVRFDPDEYDCSV
ncbi:hypothetical protein LXA43DRAFT_497930 [Ganoderma leucocontextum]|nr:hypothetical protein LXA43DRAFT_497930 [Ganoderma leucocontextum]